MSQIKSPRMARRIERNANCEGVTNQPKPSPLAQSNGTGVAQGPSAGPPGPRPMASSIGMPVQVFPTGPPPPPAPPKAQLAPQAASGSRPSPARSPQSFEPPPMGFRPEIKIPPNPMAALRKVPKIEPKNDFWVEEYRKDRSKSPLPGSDSGPARASTEHENIPEPVQQINHHQTHDTVDGAQAYPSARMDAMASNGASQQASANNNTAPAAKSPTANNNEDNGTYDERRNLSAHQQPAQERINSPFTTSSPIPNLPKPLSPIKSTQEPVTQYYVRQTQARPPSVTPNVPNTPVQNQWSPSAGETNAHPRVAQSPARSMMSPPPPPRVMSPVSRVVSPPPPQRSSNPRNVSLRVLVFFSHHNFSMFCFYYVCLFSPILVICTYHRSHRPHRHHRINLNWPINRLQHGWLNGPAIGKMPNGPITPPNNNHNQQITSVKMHHQIAGATPRPRLWSAQRPSSQASHKINYSTIRQLPNRMMAPK